MLAELETLLAVAKRRTMTSAAIELQISQSAVSKRIAHLEEELGHTLTEKQGRYVTLTPYAEELVERAKPLLQQFRYLMDDQRSEESDTILMAAARSAMTSWGPPLLAKAMKAIPSLDIQVVVFGGPRTIENVRSGDAQVGIIRGTGESAPDLLAHQLFEEEIVIVPNRLTSFRYPRSGTIEVMSINEYPESQQILERRLHRAERNWPFRISIGRRFQSSTVVTQMARAGFGHGLVPLPIAQALGIPNKLIKRLPKPGLRVPASFICRKQVLARPIVQKLLDQLKQNAPKPL